MPPKTFNPKNSSVLIFIIFLLSCKGKPEPKPEAIPEKIVDNLELIEIYAADQTDRQIKPIDWSVVSKNDSIRRVSVNQLLDSNKVKTSKDYQNAAMVFQHGNDSVAYGLAVELMRKAIRIDTTANKWLLAAAIDRYLLSKDEPQIYGTQYQKMGEEPWRLGEIDTTKITDEERIKYGVETLAEQRAKVVAMNSETSLQIH